MVEGTRQEVVNVDLDLV